MEFLPLNEEQKLPVLDTEGAVLVLAGAGSGKTRVLTARIAHLVGDLGVSPSNILAITFTNKAAGEMKERLFALTEIGGMWVSTIHSMCVRILRTFPEKRGIGKNFSIYSEQERDAVIKQILKGMGLEEKEQFKSAKFHISNAKMLGLSPREYLETFGGERNIELTVKIFSLYCERLKQNNALDFDDLLIETDRLLTEDAEAREFFAGKFRYIHVDEFQDTNAVQFDIIKQLASVHGNLFAVGDDDQSIYGWRGAEIGNILNFEKTFKGAKIYKLQQNYRSTKAILNLANASIAHNSMRKDKKLWTEHAEGEKPVYFEAEEETGEALFCAKTVFELMRQGYQYSDFAVLMRVNALTRSYEQEFTKYGIPYKVFGGFRFYERKEIKDLLAYLRIAANPFDSEAVLRIINVPRRGIGDKTVSVLQEYAEQEDLSLFDALLDADSLSLSEGIKTKLKAFGGLLKTLVLRAQDTAIDDLTRFLLQETDLYAFYDDGSDEGAAKRANLDEFLNSVEEFVRLNEGATLEDYLQQITLYSDTDEMTDENYVTVATIHAVKGLEFRCVFLCGLEENLLPTSRAVERRELEEERRLMYVAMTRAQERLYLTRSRSRFLYGMRQPTVRSEFIDEIKDELGIPAASSAPYDRYVERGFGGGGASGFSGARGGYGNGYGNGYSGGYGSSRAPKSIGRASEYSAFDESFSRGKKEGMIYGGGAQKSPRPFQSPQPQKPQPPQAQGKDTSRFTVGTKIRHPRFGVGVITATRGAAKNLIITVKFDIAGNKDLAAVLAPIEILEN